MPLHECLARLPVFPWHRVPGPGSCRRKESGLDRWAAQSAVVRSTWCPVPCGLRLGAGAHSAALDLRWESPQPLAQSPLLCPMSLVPFSTQVTSGLQLSPSAHSISRSPEPPQAGAVHQLPSLRPRKRAPSWTSFLGCIRQGPLALVTRAGPWRTPRPH
uniref:Uncharacterized protein n=1 Tax=Myotis myotis TaxID=51298 RepID=A0A7J7Z5D3_MYOMY|nr:hypothetical protein mMyoMyo1_010799 [Myotis myotis]